MERSKRYPVEVRRCAVQLVWLQRSEYKSLWAAIKAVAISIGCAAETLRRWVHDVERAEGRRAGLSNADRKHLRKLKRENLELKRTNEILRLRRHGARKD